MTRLFNKTIWLLWTKENGSPKQLHYMAHDKESCEALAGTNTDIITFEIEEFKILIDRNNKLYTNNQKVWEYVELRRGTPYEFK